MFWVYLVLGTLGVLAIIWIATRPKKQEEEEPEPLHQRLEPPAVQEARQIAQQARLNALRARDLDGVHHEAVRLGRENAARAREDAIRRQRELGEALNGDMDQVYRSMDDAFRDINRAFDQFGSSMDQLSRNMNALGEGGVRVTITTRRTTPDSESEQPSQAETRQKDPEPEPQKTLYDHITNDDDDSL